MNLFDAVVEKDKMNPNFLTIQKDLYIRNVLNDWCDGFIDRDGKFVKEFQITFNSSFWEIYCYAVFKEMAFNIDLSKDRPDFVLSLNQENLNIECVVANNADNMPPEWTYLEKVNSNYTLDERVYHQVLRILNAIDGKRTKYLKNYSQLEYVKNEPFIIALHPFDQAQFMDVNQEAIRLSLFGWNCDKATYEDRFFDIVKKNENAQLNMGVFTNSSCAEVSGVLFSTVATTGKARAFSKTPAVMFQNMRYNPDAKKPLLSINVMFNNIPNSQKSTYLKYVKAYASKFKSELNHNQYSCRKPFIEEGYQETITDGLHLYINPYAINPISNKQIELFKNHNIQIHTCLKENNFDVDSFLTPYHLIQRRVHVLKS